MGGEGYQSDSQSGLQLLGARYYDASIGRFISRDPSGYKGGLNFYAYCGNDPVNCSDPTGLVAPALYLVFVLLMAGVLAASASLR